MTIRVPGYAPTHDGEMYVLEVLFAKVRQRPELRYSETLKNSNDAKASFWTEEERR